MTDHLNTYVGCYVWLLGVFINVAFVSHTLQVKTWTIGMVLACLLGSAIAWIPLLYWLFLFIYWICITPIPFIG